jgi:hypothetical protein
MACPSHPPRLDYSNYTWRRVQITKLLYTKPTKPNINLLFKQWHLAVLMLENNKLHSIMKVKHANTISDAVSFISADSIKIQYLKLILLIYYGNSDFC